MSCPIHPQWIHDREDCPGCANAAASRSYNNNTEAMYALLKHRAVVNEVLGVRDDAELAQVLDLAYRDLDMADTIGRSEMYFHIGLLIGAVLRLTGAKRP